MLVTSSKMVTYNTISVSSEEKIVIGLLNMDIHFYVIAYFILKIQLTGGCI